MDYILLFHLFNLNGIWILDYFSNFFFWKVITDIAKYSNCSGFNQTKKIIHLTFYNCSCFHYLIYNLFKHISFQKIHWPSSIVWLLQVSPTYNSWQTWHSFVQTDSEFLQKQALMSQTGGRWWKVNPKHFDPNGFNFSRLHYH